MDKYEAFRSEIRELIASIELVPFVVDDVKHETIYTVKLEQDSQTYRLAVTNDVWTFFRASLRKHFEGRIQGLTLKTWLAFQLSKHSTYPFDDSTVDMLVESVVEKIKEYLDTMLLAFVPVHNIVLSVDEEISLGLVKLLTPKAVEQKLPRESIEKLRDLGAASETTSMNYFQMQVNGDLKYRNELVQALCFDAISIIRFAFPWWESADDESERKPSKVSIWGESTYSVLSVRPESGEIASTSSEIRLCVINRDRLDYAIESTGLDYINGHFSGTHADVSMRIVNAIRMYDSAVMSSHRWQAYYRYVVSMEIAIPINVQKEDKFRKALETTIRFGGNYLGTVGSVPPLEESADFWERFVKHVIELKQNRSAYQTRGQILHSNFLNIDDFDISLNELEMLRRLAFNVIRLVARLAVEFEWNSIGDAKTWYKNPTLSKKYSGS